MYNIFGHGGFLDDCRKAAAQFQDDRDAFLKEIHSSLMYYCWCKCEWEVIISGWPPSGDGKESRKTDAYTQVNMNWEHFADYVWNHREELKNGL